MYYRLDRKLLVMVISGFAVLCVFLQSCVITLVSNAEQNPPNFIFGDSLVDVGNNNYFVSLAKADKRPNGIDFVPAHRQPTGRFTNGKTVLDLTGDELGSNCYPLPYLAYNSNEFAATCGVNYASGGAGILNKTGAVFIGRINMDEQLDYFANTRQHIISVLGMDKATELIRSSMFSIVIGSNDFLADYLIPIIEEGTKVLTPPRMFVKLVIARFRPQLERMHRLGARKIAVANIGPLGCVPFQRETNPLAGQDCVADTNKLVMNFNSELRHLIIDLNSKLNPEAIFVYLDSYHIVSSLLQNAINYGFKVVDSGCCRVNGPVVDRLIPCGIKSIYCPNRDIYFFWDPFHPTEAANKLMAKQMLDGGPEDAFPMNLRKLRQL